jgi:hypothetical protein
VQRQRSHVCILGRHRLQQKEILRSLQGGCHHSLHATFGWRRRSPGRFGHTHRQLDIIALIGIILLIGIVKKNAILMIDFAIQGERNQGSGPEQAIYQACLLRFRPIMMTTMAALFGAIPIAVSSGTGAESSLFVTSCVKQP